MCSKQQKTLYFRRPALHPMYKYTFSIGPREENASGIFIAESFGGPIEKEYLAFPVDSSQLKASGHSRHQASKKKKVATFFFLQTSRNPSQMLNECKKISKFEKDDKSNGIPLLQHGFFFSFTRIFLHTF